MPVTKDGLIYNHHVKEAHIFIREPDGRCCVRFNEEIGVNYNVRTVWYSDEAHAQVEIDAFLKGIK